MKPYTTAEFISRAKQIFPDYDYSNVIYKNKRTDVNIICPVHGEFQRKPRDMFRNDKKGSGCPSCTKKQRWNKSLFVERATKIHGHYYDYSLSTIHTGRDIVIIKCPVHGEFLQQADVHAIIGCGCPQCALESYESKPIKNIKNILNALDIIYVQEKIFDDCAHIGKLRFDFYIEQFNIIIEYDGEFHFKDWGNQVTDKVKQQQYRDKLKDEYALKNNITMIRVSYKDDYENIIKEYFDKKFND